MKNLSLKNTLFFLILIGYLVPLNGTGITSRAKSIATNAALAYGMLFAGKIVGALNSQLIDAALGYTPPDYCIGSWDNNASPLLDLHYVKITGFNPLFLVMKDNAPRSDIIRDLVPGVSVILFHYFLYKKINPSHTFLSYGNLFAAVGHALNFIPFDPHDGASSVGMSIFHKIMKWYEKWKTGPKDNPE